MASIEAERFWPGQDNADAAPRRGSKQPGSGPIVFVLPGLGAGGAERVVSVIANELAARGRQVCVVTLAEADAPSYYAYAPDVTLIRLGLPPQQQSWAPATMAGMTRVVHLRRAIAGLSPQVVISFLTRTNVLTLLATIGTTTPVVVSERNNPQLQHFGQIWSWLRARLYRRAFGLVTMTQGAMDCFPPAMRRRQWVIPNPVLSAPYIPASDGRGKRLVAVGRLVPQKGFDLLLQAFHRIAPVLSDWQLVIWGEGPERAVLEAMVQQLGLADRVSMPGVSADPGAWAAQGDLFVMSSRYEGWGNALLEALAAGLPAISFDCPWGPGQMIEHGVNGMLVAPEDVNALAEGLGALMRDPVLRARLGVAAMRSVDKFAPANIVAAWEAVILESTVARAPVRYTLPFSPIF